MMQGGATQIIRTRSNARLSYLKLYRAADRLDCVLIFLGFLGACAVGVGFPIQTILLGDVLNEIGALQRFADSPGSLPVNFHTLLTDTFNKVKEFALRLTYLAIGFAVANCLEMFCWMWAGNRQAGKLRAQYVRSILNQDMVFFDIHATSGGLLQSLHADTLAVQEAIGEKVGVLIHAVVAFCTGMGIALWRGWDLTLVMLGCVPIMGSIVYLVTQICSKVETKAAKNYATASQVAQETISNVRTVAAFHQQTACLQRYQECLMPTAQHGLRVALCSGLNIGITHLVMMFMHAIAFWYGSMRISAGAYTGGQVVNVLLATVVAGVHLGQAVPMFKYIGEGISAGNRMFNIIDNHVLPTDEGMTKPRVMGCIEFKDVFFAYPSQPMIDVFRGINMRIEAGQFVALVGASGSGKSTAIQLIQRFYDPRAGQVLLDGFDLKFYSQHWLRQNMGLVTQEPVLLATTIMENIRLGARNAGMDAVFKAAQSANIHKFIMSLPDQYNTHVGERGVTLSGGQRQRIALARALVRDPKILLLDEATSALDNTSEKMVQEALSAGMKGRTTVVVAHRLSTVAEADKIFVIRNGVVAESGSHHQLLKNKEGVYATLVKVQMVKAAVETSGIKVEIRQPGPTASAQLLEINAAASVTTDPLSDFPVKASANQDRATSKTGVDEDEPMIVCAINSSKDDNAADVVEKDGQQHAVETQKSSKVALFGLVRSHWYQAVAGCIASCLLGGMTPSMAIAMGKVLDAYYDPSKSQMRKTVNLWSGVFGVIGAGALVASIIQQWAFGGLGVVLANRLRGLLLKAILHQDIGWFDNMDNSSDKLVATLAHDTMRVRGAVGDVLGVICQNLTVLAACYAIGFMMAWRVALVMTGSLPFLVLGAYLNNVFAVGFSTTMDKLYTSANSMAAEAFRNIKVIVAYGIQVDVADMYSKELMKPLAIIPRMSMAAGLGVAYCNFVIMAVYALIVWFGGHEVYEGNAKLEDMLIAVFCVLLAGISVGETQRNFPDVGRAGVSVANVFKILNRQPPIDALDESGLIPWEATSGCIQFHGVHFVYPTRPKVLVLSNFSLTVEAGKTVALVGESGSGKSTIIGLLTRFYDPQQGSIMLDGFDLQRLNLGWLRSKIGLVGQEPVLFGGTFLDNIRFSRPEASLAEVEQAAVAALADDFIKNTTSGYNSIIGEGGVQLSGGQKQRIAIARVLLKDPKILLLDEATSALDTESEKRIQQILDKVMLGRTAIVVAHRLTTVQNADKIVVMRHGAIVESGKHGELLKIPSGAYAALWALSQAASSTSE